MPISRNNFYDPRNCRIARYKLWVKYRPEFVSDCLPQTKSYYSHENRYNPQSGLQKLMALVNERRDKIIIAILYDNLTNKELQRFRSGNLRNEKPDSEA